VASQTPGPDFLMVHLGAPCPATPQATLVEGDLSESDPNSTQFWPQMD